MASNKKKRHRRNKRARNGGSRPATPEQKRPWYKSQLTWTGAVVTAVVIAGLGAGLSALTTDATSRVINHIAEPATPFTATVSVDYADPPGLALPTLLADGPDLAMLIKGEEFDTSALLERQHGAAVESLHVDVTLTGLSQKPVTILKPHIGLVDRCGPPLAGTYLEIGHQGGRGQVAKMTVDLDSPAPKVVRTDGDQFPGFNVDLKKDERQTLSFDFKAVRHYCRWHLLIDYQGSSGVGTKGVDERPGRPFALTGKAKHYLHTYKAVLPGSTSTDPQ